MVQSFNQITLYKKMDNNLSEKAGLEISVPKIMYSTRDEEKEIVLNEEFDGVLTINEFDSMWSPTEHNLLISKRFSFKNPAVLFGEDGITMPGNKIGIAVHIHSKTSKFQRTLNIDTLINQKAPVSIEFFYQFPASSLRGNIELEFFLFLQECNERNPKHASRTGMILSKDAIDNLIIVVDGEGSIFPMSEFEDKMGPLWRLEKNWVEANIDTFDSSNVNLSMNIAHPLFEQVKAGKQAASRALMGDVLVQAMTMIIQQVIIIEEFTLDDVSQAAPDSILAAVGYWISTFEIDTSSLFSITNTMKSYWDRKMIAGEEVNDKLG